MKKSSKTLLTTAGILAAAVASVQSANAHMEPKTGEGMEKCYGVVKAHKNDCASQANKHSCAGQAKVDNDPNEWTKLPKGLCEKLVGGSLVSQTEKTTNETEPHSDDHTGHDH